MSEKRRTIRSYVLRSGRLSKSAAHALEAYVPLYGIDPADSMLDLKKIFPKPRPIIIEIGFGMGHATIELAEGYPEYNFIGIEVYPPGVGKVLSEIHERSLENLKVLRADAATVLDRMVPDSSVCGFHVFFPDPWPKKKHHKRRLLQKSFMQTLARKLETGGYLYAVTDWEDYARQILRELQELELLSNPYDGFAPPRPWRPETSFQRKGEAKNHPIFEIWFEKEAAY